MIDFAKYKYIDTAIGGVQNRNNPVDIGELRSLLNGNVFDCYRTYFQYPVEFINHVNTTGSVRDYSGQCYSKYIPIDIDSTNLVEALDSSKKLLLNLKKQYEFNLNLLPVFFSGAKGFHIMLPTNLFGIKPSKDLDKIFKRIVENFIPEETVVDTSIYDKTRLFRINNTINSKSGLYKIALSIQELFELSIDEIKELAKSPRNGKFWDTNSELNEALHQVYINALKPEKTNTEAELKRYKNLLKNAVYEGGRNNSLTSMAGMLNAKGINKETVIPILQSINKTKCNPPLPEYEIENIMKSIYKNEVDGGNSFNPINIKNFMGHQEPEINWIVEDFIVEGALVLLVAKPKVGKSILALNFALAVANGETIFKKKTIKGKTLYIALEDREKLVQSRLWNILGNPEDIGLDIYCGDISLDKENCRTEIKQRILTNKYKLVVIDPLIEAYRGSDENNPNEMAKLLSYVRELAQTTNTSILLVHHARKSDGIGGDIIRGSSAIWGGVDGSIILSPLQSEDNLKRVTMEAILRDAESGEKAVISLNDTLKWQLEGTFEEFQVKSTVEKIKEYLKEGQATIKEVSTGTGVNYDTVKKSLQRMCKTGEVNSVSCCPSCQPP